MMTANVGQAPGVGKIEWKPEDANTIVRSAQWRRQGSRPISLTVRKKGIKRKRVRPPPPQKSVHKMQMQTTVSKKIAKHSSAHSAPSSNSANQSSFFVNISEIINVKKAMNNKDKNAVKVFIEKQRHATERNIDPEKKGRLFAEAELAAWLRENNRIQTRARFTEIYSGESNLSWLRYGKDPSNKQDFETRLTRYQLQCNLAHKALPQRYLHGEPYFAIDKLQDLSPSFTLYLYQRGFSINSQKNNFQRYSLKNRAMLQAIDNGEIPSFADSLLNHLPTMKYYAGCLIAEIHDFRHINRWYKKPKTKRILLRPTGYTLSSDALALATQYRDQKARQGVEVDPKTFLNVCNAFEEKILMALGPLLCFEPSPRVMQAATVANYNIKVNLVRRLSRDEARHGLKMAKKKTEWKHYLPEPETSAKESAQSARRLESASKERKINPKKPVASSSNMLFHPRPRSRMRATQDLLRKTHKRNNEIRDCGTGEFGRQLFRQASFVYFTRNDRPSYLHGLLLRDPEMTSTVLAGNKQGATTTKTAAKTGANPRPAPGRPTAHTVDPKKFWPASRHSTPDDITSRKPAVQRASSSKKSSHSKSTGGRATADSTKDLKRRFANTSTPSTKSFNLAAHSGSQVGNNSTYSQAARSANSKLSMRNARAGMPSATVGMSRTPAISNGVASGQGSAAYQNPAATASQLTAAAAKRAQAAQAQGLPTATATARQSSSILPGANALNLVGITAADAKAVPASTAYPGNIVKLTPAALRQQQHLMARALNMQQKQLASLAASGGLNNNMLSNGVLQHLQQQYLLMAAYRNHQMMNSKNMKKQQQQMMNGANGNAKK